MFFLLTEKGEGVYNIRVENENGSHFVRRRKQKLPLSRRAGAHLPPFVKKVA